MFNLDILENLKNTSNWEDLRNSFRNEIVSKISAIEHVHIFENTYISEVSILILILFESILIISLNYRYYVD